MPNPSVRLSLFSSLALSLACTMATAAPDDPNVPPPGADPELYKQVIPQSPEDTIANMEVPDGYKLEIVASEPMIREPVLCVWDGNGRMYVAQMDTYMQDADATDEGEPTSKVLRLEDTDGDGKMDTSTVFAEGLVIPRMILPLDDRVIIGTTHTRKMFAYTDTDGDGKADKKELWWDGGKQGGNMEHQPSGLIWGIDNWIYTTYTGLRLRYTTGTVEVENIGNKPSQWGLDSDDRGRMYAGSGGGERSFQCFQQPWEYGKIDAYNELAKDFLTVWPIDNIPDTQGGARRFREDNTLNHFTAGCGHSIYTGTATPAFKNNLFICEPVGRLIRRAVATNEKGKRILSNPHGQGEFIRTKDPNFRPVNTATGPDGCLHIVDMYRGIIQQGNWTRKGSYLRGVIDKYGMAKTIGRGRIYRLVPKDGVAKTKKPNMLNETPAQLVAHLNNPNAWWRNTARKLIILRGDKSVKAPLEAIVRDANAPAHAKVNAIWTLEGLNLLSAPALADAAKTNNTDVRIAVLQASEALLKDNNPAVVAIHKGLGKPGNNEEVRIQAFLSAQKYAPPAIRGTMMEGTIADAAPRSPRAWYGEKYQESKRKAAAEAKRLAAARKANAELSAAVERGRKHYATMCAACHAPNGKGVPMAGTNTTLGAPLNGSARVVGNTDRLVRILLHGLIGPIDGKTYPGIMAPMASQEDAWLADVATYVRNDWGNKSSLVKPETIARIRKETKDRTQPWTMEQLKPWSTDVFKERATWKLNASHNGKALHQAIDGNAGTRWDTGTHQKKGMWFTIELPEPAMLGGVSLDTSGSPKDFAKTAKVETSLNGKTWTTLHAKVGGGGATGNILFPKPTRVKSVRITVQDTQNRKYWSIHELNLISSDGKVTNGNATAAAATPAKKKGRRQAASTPAKIEIDPSVEFSVLVFSKTAGFRHKSIGAGVKALKEIAKENKFGVFHTEDANLFTLENLKKFKAIVFLNTTGNILNDEQQKAFESYIQAGGGFAGVHSATDTEYKWPWFEKFIGAFFAGHPQVQNADLVKCNHNHPSVDFLPDRWNRKDEWYNFRNISPKINVILNLDEKTYNGGKNGDNHPAAWYQEYDGGRMWYTAGGHTNESYSEPLFRKHLKYGILYAAGKTKQPKK